MALDRFYGCEENGCQCSPLSDRRSPQKKPLPSPHPPLYRRTDLIFDTSIWISPYPLIVRILHQSELPLTTLVWFPPPIMIIIGGHWRYKSFRLESEVSIFKTKRWDFWWIRRRIRVLEELYYHFNHVKKIILDFCCHPLTESGLFPLRVGDRMIPDTPHSSDKTFPLYL